MGFYGFFGFKDCCTLTYTIGEWVGASYGGV